MMLRLLLAAVLSVGSRRAPPQEDRGRPVILLLHGRGMNDRDTAELRKWWLDGLTAGAKSLTRAPLLTERDVRLVWYADVLDPRSTEACDYQTDDPRARRDATTDPEHEIVRVARRQRVWRAHALVTRHGVRGAAALAVGRRVVSQRCAQAVRVRATARGRDRAREARGPSRDSRRAQSRIARRVRLSLDASRYRRGATPRERRLDARIRRASSSADRRRLDRRVWICRRASRRGSTFGTTAIRSRCR